MIEVDQYIFILIFIYKKKKITILTRPFTSMFAEALFISRFI